MGDKIKSFLSYFFIGLMFLGLGALLFYLGIEGLTGRKNPSDVTSYLSEDDVSKWVTITVNEASPEILTVRHKALLVIPWGKDHFFFAASKDGVIVTVSADEDWYEKNFDKNGISKDKDGVILVGQVGSFFNAYELDSTNIKEMIEKQAEKIVLDESSFTSLTEVYIDTEESKITDWVLIVLGIAIAFGGIGHIIYETKPIQSRRLAKKLKHLSEEE